jgi:6-phosphogluconolactonase
MNERERGELVVLPDQAALAEAGAQRFVALAQAAISAHGRFSVALSGGSTPRGMYERLAQPPHRDAIDWPNVYIFWGDERYVPPDDAESSFRMAREALLAHVPLPAANIYPVPTVGGTPEAAAKAYAETINAFFGAAPPHFDLILLGMGPDGHTASLFPGAPELTAPGGDLVVVVYNAPKPPPTRLSFTLRLINDAANVIFMVAGADKAPTLREVLHGPLQPARLPAQSIQPAHGALVWLVDTAAAQAL